MAADDDLSSLNSTYWGQLCGSRAASKLGITAGDAKGIATFDKWFFWFYPYLDDSSIIPWDSLRDATVLEVGLGYGTVTRRLNASCRKLYSVDIAPRAVEFAEQTAPGATCVCADARDLPFPDASMDCVVSIGCLHMTGDLQQGLRECLRVLRPGGRLIVMVYNVFSYKRWIVAPITTLRALRIERRGDSLATGSASPRRVSWFWDRSPSGAAPPHTEFASRTQLLQLVAGTEAADVRVINVDNITDLLPRGLQRVALDHLRVRMLRGWLSRRAGLDLYLIATK